MYNRRNFSRRPVFSSRRPSDRRVKGKQIDVNKFINKAEITERVEHFKPEHAFTDFKITEVLKKNIVAKGYTDPTPIQDRIIPHVLKGDDVVGIANTGTGKTAAFLIPLIEKVLNNNQEQILIVAPTRELAVQIQKELKGFTRNLNIYSVCCVGGAGIGAQISELKYFNSFVIGTPGRLKDLMDRRILNLSTFKTVVLDEADRMLDMGFIKDTRFLLSHMHKERHTLFFSATITREIDHLIREFLKDPVTVSVKTGDTSKDVDQDVVKINPGDHKIEVLENLLRQTGFDKVLVFGRTKHGVEKLAKMLVHKGFKADSIHGNKSHGQRQRALDLFKASHVQVLVATDVAARGIDVSGISHVINYDAPSSYEDYVHRIGRTGRAGAKGKAITFIE